MQTAPELDVILWNDAIGTLEELLAIWSTAKAPSSPPPVDALVKDTCSQLDQLGRSDLAAHCRNLQDGNRMSPQRLAQVDMLLSLVDTDSS